MRLIDADKLEDVLAKHQTHYYGDSDYYEGISQGFNLAIYDVKETPTIEAEPRETGYWLPYEFGDYHWHKCSVCGKADKYIETIRNGGDLQAIRRFCPICGARMHKEEL